MKGQTNAWTGQSFNNRLIELTRCLSTNQETRLWLDQALNESNLVATVESGLVPQYKSGAKVISKILTGIVPLFALRRDYRSLSVIRGRKALRNSLGSEVLSR